jgi:hypothetical protein
VIRRGLLALLAALVLAACGGGAGGDGGEGTAQLWVTTDRGAEVLLTAEVPAGVTLMEALKGEAEVETRYGGRYVQAIDGVEGSLAGQRDWFFFVNGIEPDVGAVEVTLRDGDVGWWDFRSWAEGADRQPVVVGAFPEPFRHGWSGRVRPLEVVAPPELSAEANALRALLAPSPGAEGEPNRFLLEVAGGEPGALLTATRGEANDAPVTFLLRGSLEAVRAAARALAADPSVVARRYEARFDERGAAAG